MKPKKTRAAKTGTLVASLLLTVWCGTRLESASAAGPPAPIYEIAFSSVGPINSDVFIAEIPGVEAASAADFGGVLGRTWRQNIAMPGTDHDSLEAAVVPVTPGFLETVKIPLLAGRTFAPADLDIERPRILIVNESFARYFGGDPAVGRHFDPGLDNERSRYEVVGVVADAATICAGHCCPGSSRWSASCWRPSACMAC